MPNQWNELELLLEEVGGQVEVDLAISPQIVIFLYYTHKLQDLEKEFNIQINFREDSIYMKEGNKKDIFQAQETILRYCNYEIVAEYLEQSDYIVRGYYQPYVALITDEQYVCLVKDYPRTLVMTRLKYTDVAKQIQDKYGYKCCFDSLKDMPQTFVILITRRKHLQKLLPNIKRIIETIRQKLDNKITPQDNFQTSNRGKEFHGSAYQIPFREISMHKLDAIWINAFYDIKLLEKDKHVHLSFKDDPKQIDNVILEIKGSQLNKVTEVQKFLKEENLDKWKLVLIEAELSQQKRRLRLDIQNEIRKFQKNGDTDVIYWRSQLEQYASKIDEQYETSTMKLLSDLLYRRKIFSDCIFILSTLDRANQIKHAVEQIIKAQGTGQKYPKKPNFWNN